MPVRAWILIAVLLLMPVPAHAGWFGWLWGGQTKTVAQQAVPPGTQAVPAMDGYVLATAIGVMVTLIRRRSK